MHKINKKNISVSCTFAKWLCGTCLSAFLRQVEACFCLLLKSEPDVSPVKHLIIRAPKPQPCGILGQQYLLLIDHRSGHSRTQISQQSKFSWVLSLLLSDVQHAVMGAVPFGEGPCRPGSAVQRGELCVSQPSAADHGRPDRHALPESCHQGGVTVRASRRSGTVGQCAWPMFHHQPLVSPLPGSILWSIKMPGLFLKTM